MSPILAETKIVTLYRPSEETENVWEVRAMYGSEVIGKARIRCWTECVAIGVAFGLDVREEYRRQGLARQIMQSVETCASKNGITLLLATIRDDNPASKNLVLSIGYA